MVEQTSFQKINDKFDKEDIDMDINTNDINVPIGVRPKSSIT
jgi:frataxin-like iron-binding protein CyaY